MTLEPHPFLIILPYGGHDPLRLHAYRLTLAWYRRAGWPVLTANDPLEGERPFSVARAVNNGVRVGFSAETIVICGADSICSHQAIEQGVDLARQSEGLVWCFDWYHRLSRNHTSRLHESTIEDVWGMPTERTLVEPPGHCCVAVRRDRFLEVGGYDEGFEGWGFEDCELTDRLGVSGRVEGSLIHLWHGERRADDSPVDSPVGTVEGNRLRWLSKR